MAGNPLFSLHDFPPLLEKQKQVPQPPKTGYAIAVKTHGPNDHLALMKRIALLDWRRNFINFKHVWPRGFKARTNTSDEKESSKDSENGECYEDKPEESSKDSENGECYEDKSESSKNFDNTEEGYEYDDVSVESFEDPLSYAERMEDFLGFKQ